MDSEYEGDILVKVTWNKNLTGNLLTKSLNPKKNQLLKLGGNTTSSVGLSKVNFIERENLFLRLVKNCVLKERLNFFEHKETTTNNSCFIETLIIDLTKKILSSEDFKKCFINNIEQQPLSIYKWSSNEILPSQGEIRQKYLNNLKLLAASQIGDLPNERSKKSKSLMDAKSTHSRMNATNTLSKGNTTSKEFNGGVTDSRIVKEEFGDAQDNEIQEKYYKDLINKYKYTINEVNEKIICVNDETKKLISDVIMENTIYNIINESIEGVTDLTVKPRIYFFLGKSNIGIENNNNNDNLKSGNLNSNNNDLDKNSNNPINEENKGEVKNDVNKTEENKNEENKSNVSIGSKKSKGSKGSKGSKTKITVDAAPA